MDSGRTRLRGAVYTVRSAEGYRHRLGTMSPREAKRYIQRYVAAARDYAARQGRTDAQGRPEGTDGWRTS